MELGTFSWELHARPCSKWDRVEITHIRPRFWWTQPCPPGFVIEIRWPSRPWCTALPVPQAKPRKTTPHSFLLMVVPLWRILPSSWSSQVVWPSLSPWAKTDSLSECSTVLAARRLSRMMATKLPWFVAWVNAKWITSDMFLSGAALRGAGGISDGTPAQFFEHWKGQHIKLLNCLWCLCWRTIPIGTVWKSSQLMLVSNHDISFRQQKGQMFQKGFRSGENHDSVVCTIFHTARRNEHPSVRRCV